MQGQQHGTIIIGLQQTSKTIYVSCDTSNSCNFSIKKQHKCSLNKKAKSVSISLPNLRWGNKFDNINEVSYPLTRTFIIDIHCIQVKLEVFFVGPLFLTSFSLSHFALLCLIWRSSSEIELQSNFWGGARFRGLFSNALPALLLLLLQSPGKFRRLLCTTHTNGKWDWVRGRREAGNFRNRPTALTVYLSKDCVKDGVSTRNQWYVNSVWCSWIPKKYTCDYSRFYTLDYLPTHV